MRPRTSPGAAPPPEDGALRWHPALSDLVSSYTGPALVALVTHPETGEAVNLHRTWLASNGASKASIGKPRRLLEGDCARGVVRLWQDEEVTLGLTLVASRPR